MKTFKKIILDDLKSQGFAACKKIKSVTYKSYSGGDSVTVTAINLSDEEKAFVESTLSDYEYGSFNGMEDIYEYKKDAVKKERQCKYAFLRNE